MANWQSSVAQKIFKGPGKNKKSRLHARRKLRSVVLVTNDPYVKDVCMGIVVGDNECICRRLRARETLISNLFFLRDWKEPFSKALLRQEVRDESPTCRRCKECIRPDEGLLMLEVS